MTRHRVRVTVAAAMLLAAASLGLGAGPAQAAGSLTATFRLDSEWDTGYQASYVITNGTASTIASWRMEFDLPSGGTITGFWEADVTHSGNHYVAVNKAWNGSLAPGATVTWGYNGTGPRPPVNCTINGGSCAGGGTGGDTQPPTAPTNLHVTATTSSSVSLAWTAATDNVGVTGYVVSTFRNGTLVATTASSGTSATVSGLASATTFTFAVKARDAAGNSSTASNQVSATTGSGSGGGTVAVPVAPYVDMGAFPTPLLTDLTSASGVKSWTMAFIISVGCKASWFNAFDPRAGFQKDQVDAIRANGGDVKISFGGASGIELAQDCTSVDSLATEYQAVVTAYQLKYIDLDIESAAVADPASIDRRSKALAKVQAATPGLKVSLTLPVLPEGLTADGLNVVRSAINNGVKLDLVNVMAMDYQRPTGDYGDFAVQAARSTFSQLKTLFPGLSDAQVWRLVGVTPMLGQNDDGGIFNQDDARQLVTFAQTQHLGFLSFWETTRDRNACSGALFQCTNVPQQPFEFSRIFNVFTG